MLAIDVLIHRINEKGCPIVVGLDPALERIPEFIRENAVKEYGNTLQAAAESLYHFNRLLLEGLHPLIPAVKLQMACYEMFGKWGLDVFQRTAELAGSLNLTVIDDSKRGDIGSTARFYAQGHLGSVPLIHGRDEAAKADYLTLNPFLGSDAILPFVETCREHNKGLFILVRTSNASASDYQEALINGQPLFIKIAEDIQKIGQDLTGEFGYSSIGAVVGATWPRELEQLRSVMPNAFFLVPGYGAQGAGAEELSAAFDKKGLGAIVNSSRGIIFAYQSPALREKYADPGLFVEASIEAVRMMRADLLRSLRQADKLPDNW